MAVKHALDKGNTNYDGNQLVIIEGPRYDLTRFLVEERLGNEYTTDQRDEVVSEVIKRSTRPVGRERTFFIANLVDNIATTKGKRKI